MSVEHTNPYQLREIMVDRQVRPSDVSKLNVIEAMLATPRERYLPKGLQNIAYIGDNICLEDNRVVLAPRTSAKILDALDIQPDEAVLNVGCGFGYSAAILACFSDVVIAVEENPSWAERAYENLCAQDLAHVIVQMGALAAGAVEYGPYNVITIEGAVERVPSVLVDQLAEGGRICVIMKDAHTSAVKVGQKRAGAIVWRFLFDATAPILPGFFREAVFSL